MTKITERVKFLEDAVFNNPDCLQRRIEKLEEIVFSKKNKSDNDESMIISLIIIVGIIAIIGLMINTRITNKLEINALKEYRLPNQFPNHFNKPRNIFGK